MTEPPLSALFGELGASSRGDGPFASAVVPRGEPEALAGERLLRRRRTARRFASAVAFPGDELGALVETLTDLTEQVSGLTDDGLTLRLCCRNVTDHADAWYVVDAGALRRIDAENADPATVISHLAPDAPPHVLVSIAGDLRLQAARDAERYRTLVFAAGVVAQGGWLFAAARGHAGGVFGAFSDAVSSGSAEDRWRERHLVSLAVGHEERSR